jgi:hypothetical protein
MSFLTDLFGKQPTEAKNLLEAKSQLDSAKASAEQVAALFTAAGLDLDALLAAGPDSLKAHLEGLAGDDEALATALLEVEQLEAKVETVTAEAAAANAKFSAVSSVFPVVGVTNETTPEQYGAIFADHVKKAAALELAKTGHAPVAEVTPAALGKPAIDPSLHGLARVEAHFKAQAAAKSAAK